MSRKGKYSKEIKIKACEDYIAGKESLERIYKATLKGIPSNTAIIPETNVIYNVSAYITGISSAV